MTQNYNGSRASFVKYCIEDRNVTVGNPCFDIWGSLLTSSGEVFADTSMEFSYICWLDAWTAGFTAAVQGIADNRIGINDKINPDLLSRKLRDWG